MTEKTFTAADLFVNETTRVARTLANSADHNGRRVEVAFSTPTVGGRAATIVQCTLYYEPPRKSADDVAAALLVENAALRAKITRMQQQQQQQQQQQNK